MDKKSVLLNAAMAGLLAASAGIALTQNAVAADVKCHGANTCKGTGACGGAGHDCAGKNTCKGQGWIKVADEKECTAKGGSTKEPAAPAAAPTAKPKG